MPYNDAVLGDSLPERPSNHRTPRELMLWLASSLGDGKVDGFLVLKNLWFHSFENEVLKWQGQVIDHDEITGYYLIQLYEWFSGSPTNKTIIHISDMESWNFFESNEEMIEAYEIHHKVTN